MHVYIFRIYNIFAITTIRLGERHHMEWCYVIRIHKGNSIPLKLQLNILSIHNIQYVWFACQIFKTSSCFWFTSWSQKQVIHSQALKTKHQLQSSGVNSTHWRWSYIASQMNLASERFSGRYRQRIFIYSEFVCSKFEQIMSWNMYTVASD